MSKDNLEQPTDKTKTQPADNSEPSALRQQAGHLLTSPTEKTVASTLGQDSQADKLTKLGLPTVDMFDSKIDTSGKSLAGTTGDAGKDKSTTTTPAKSAAETNPFKDSGSSDLTMFEDTGHLDPTIRQKMSEKFADIKAAGTEYMAFEGVPSDITNASLNGDTSKLATFLTNEGLNANDEISMLKAADKAGLKIVGLEDPTLRLGDVMSELHGALKDPAGKTAFDAYANNDSATKDSPEGKTLQSAIEKDLAQANPNWTSTQVSAEANDTMTQLDKMKSTGADFKTLSKAADSLLPTETEGAKLTEAITDNPDVLKAATDYISAAIKARDAASAAGSGDFQPPADAEQALKSALAAAKMSPSDIDWSLNQINQTISMKGDTTKADASILQQVNKFLSENLGSDEATKAVGVLSGVTDEAVRNALVITEAKSASAFSDEASIVLSLDWRNREIAGELADTLSKGKTALFAGGTHLKDFKDIEGTPADPKDSVGFVASTMLDYLRKDMGTDKVGEPSLWIGDKKVAPNDLAEISRLENPPTS